MANEITNTLIEKYIELHTSQEPEHLKKIVEETELHLGDRARMLTGHVEGRFLKFLVSILQPEHILEIGCFTGYSALSMAEALPEKGHITTCDIDEEHANIATANFANSMYANRISLVKGPALTTLKLLQGPYDFVFIDADKENYLNYYKAVLPLLSQNGIIIFDNVLWSGRVLHLEDQSPETSAIRALNNYLANDSSIECVMLPIRDGITLVQRKNFD